MLSPIQIDDMDIDIIDSFFIPLPVVPLGNETLSSMMNQEEEEEGLALGGGNATGRRAYPFLPSTTMDLELTNTPLSHEATEIAFTHFTGFGFTEQQQEGLRSPSSVGDFSSLLSPSSGLDPDSDHAMLISPSTSTTVINEGEDDDAHGMQLEAAIQRVPNQEGNANGVMVPEEGRISRRKQKLVCKVVEQPPTKVKSNKNNPPRVLLHELAITDDMPPKRRKQIANAKKNYNRREAEKIKLVKVKTNLAEALAVIERLQEENRMLRKRLNKY